PYLRRWALIVALGVAYRAVGDPGAGPGTNHERDVRLTLTDSSERDIPGEIGVTLRAQGNQLCVHDDGIPGPRATIGVADKRPFDHIDTVRGPDGIASCQHQ